MKMLSQLDMTGLKIVNVADPSAGTDVVNLQYVQGLLAGLAWKAPVRAASTANVNTASPGATLDGVTLAVNDRVLLKDQTTAGQNGIYVWTASGAALTRATDADSTGELRNATTFVSEGTTNADKSFTQTTEITTVNTTGQTWVQQGGGAVYTAGNGIGISSNVISVTPLASGGITVAAGGVSVDTAIVVRKYAANIGGTTSIAVVHNLGTQDVTWSLRQVSNQEYVYADAVATDANTLTLTFASAPAANALRIVVHA